MTHAQRSSSSRKNGIGQRCRIYDDLEANLSGCVNDRIIGPIEGRQDGCLWCQDRPDLVLAPQVVPWEDPLGHGAVGTPRHPACPTSGCRPEQDRHVNAYGRRWTVCQASGAAKQLHPFLVARGPRGPAGGSSHNHTSGMRSARSPRLSLPEHQPSKSRRAAPRRSPVPAQSQISCASSERSTTPAQHAAVSGGSSWIHLRLMRQAFYQGQRRAGDPPSGAACPVAPYPNDRFMESSETPQPLEVPPTVIAYVMAYRCTALTDKQNDTLLPRIRELTLGVGPGTKTEAKKILFPLCLFAGDMEHLDGTLDDHLSEKNVAYWSRTITRSVKESTKTHYMRWLRCALRVHKGLPAHLTGSGRKPTAGLPYSPSMVAEIVALSGTSAAAASLVAGAGYGVIRPESVGAHFEVIDGVALLVLADGTTRPGLAVWRDQARSLCGLLLDKEAWNAARSSFAARGEISIHDSCA